MTALGPHKSVHSDDSDDAILEDARATHRSVGRTFWLASRFLPRHLRDDVHLLYLVLRTLDDAVDDKRPDADAVVGGCETWARTGQAETREARILADLATRHPIDPWVVDDFCAGMRADMASHVIATEADLDLYCYRVAGTVGLLMTALLGATDREAARPAAIALGQAMQRTNILRDIDEDLEHGRIYLAADTVARLGSLHPGQRADLLRDQIARADALYDNGFAGIRHLKRGSRAVAAAAAMYQQILRQIEREGLGVEPGRAVVTLPRKVMAGVSVQRRVRSAGEQASLRSPSA